MTKVLESRVADFLASRDELWINATQDEKELAITLAKAKIEKENQRRKAMQELERKEDLAAYAYYKLRLGEQL